MTKRIAKNKQTARITILAVAAFVFCLFSPALPAQTAEKQEVLKNLYGSFTDFEYMGSSLLTRVELEKLLHLSAGADYRKMEKACQRVKKTLSDRRIITYTDIVDGGAGNLFAVVDISEPGRIIPTRPLSDPRYIRVPTEKPELLLKDLRARLLQLTFEGRSYKEIYKNGNKNYSDAVADAKVEEIVAYAKVSALRDAWLNIVQSDPSPERRVDAIELLNWAGNYPDTMARIMPALDDVNQDVRVAAAKFIYARLDLLPYDFPYGKLTAAFCRQIQRPSHGDRLKGMACLSVLLRDKPEMVPPTREVAGQQIELIAQRTHIPPLRELTEKVKLLLSQYREKTGTKKPVIETEF